MAELAGGAFLSTTLQVLFDRLASRELINFFRGRKHDDRLLKKLKLKLLALSKVLNDAENKEITDRAVKDWLDELKDAVYHAEDLVDEIATEAWRCKVEAEYQSGTNKSILLEDTSQTTGFVAPVIEVSTRRRAKDVMAMNYCSLVAKHCPQWSNGRHFCCGLTTKSGREVLKKLWHASND